MVLPVTMGVVVDAIPLAPPRVSLLSSVDVSTGDGEWQSGIRFMPEACAPPEAPYWWTCGEPGGEIMAPQGAQQGDGPGILANIQAGPSGTPNYTKDIGDNEDEVDFTPYDIWVGFKCGNMAVRNGEYQTKARQAMDAFQSSLIERELWQGNVAQAAGFPNDYLENSPTALNSGASTAYVTALAEMEQGLAECQPGQTGIIHAQPRVVTAWLQNGLVAAEASGRRLRTQLGTIVVPGAGYPGTGDGLATATPAASWAYGTGMVRVYLGDLSVVPSEGVEVDRTNNDVQVRVERTVAAVWDECCQLSVKVDLTKAL